MTAPCAISAQLVDIRNYATEKCVRLTIHVPTAQMPLVQQAFGWPTSADPVPVAIARLDIGKEDDTPPRSVKDPPAGANRSWDAVALAEAKRDWDDLSPAQQAGIRCNQECFYRYLFETHGYQSQRPDEAAQAVREICDVESRKELVIGTEAGLKWMRLEIDYRAWLRAAEVVP